MELNLITLWSTMGFAVKGVVIILTMQAVACIAVVIDRVIVLTRSTAKSKRFAAESTPLMEAGEHEKVIELASKSAGSHLASFVYTGLRTFLERRSAGDDRDKAAELTRRALERRGEQLSNDLNRGMNVLATTGSVAPFVGLLGTVLGIINAFKMIASNGSGGIGTIGAAIGESLIVTGYGLCVAIPSVLVFNWLSGRLAAYESGLVNAGGELVDRLEGDLYAEPTAELPVRAPTAMQQAPRAARSNGLATSAA